MILSNCSVTQNICVRWVKEYTKYLNKASWDQGPRKLCKEEGFGHSKTFSPPYLTRAQCTGKGAARQMGCKELGLTRYGYCVFQPTSPYVCVCHINIFFYIYI